MTYFLFFYSVFYMGNAVYGTYMPVYFQSIGISQVEIGALLSVGPLVAVLAQPLWGAASDRAKTKNSVLMLLIGGAGAIILFFPISNAFHYLLVMVCLFTFFQTSISSISDAVTLEELEKHPRWSFGPIRLGGTIGYAVMSITFGWIAKYHIGYLFSVYASVMLVSLILLTRFPRISGYQTTGNRMRVWVLFKNRKLMTYMGFNLILQITLGFYYTFFPVYLREMGGDSVVLGWSMVISSLSEVPFLLLAGRILKKIRITHILLIASVAAALRWFSFAFTQNPYWVLPAQVLHGLIFVVLSVTMAVFINQEVPQELKASGQTLNGLLSLGLARIVGSFAGGFASEAFGIKHVFLYNAWITLACAVCIGVLIYRENKTPSAKYAQSEI